MIRQGTAATNGARVVNLTFHGIGEQTRPLASGEADVWLGADVFERILDTVAPRDDVRLFFDDGNRSDVDVAVPALVARGLSATFGLVAGRLGEPGFLTVEDVRGLRELGMSVASHGMSHKAWRGLSDAELREEIVDSRGLIEEVAGGRVTHAVCPFGSYDRRVLARLRAAGFERVFTSDGGAASADAWLQPRTSLLSHHGDRKSVV